MRPKSPRKNARDNEGKADRNQGRTTAITPQSFILQHKLMNVKCGAPSPQDSFALEEIGGAHSDWIKPADLSTIFNAMAQSQMDDTKSPGDE